MNDSTPNQDRSVESAEQAASQAAAIATEMQKTTATLNAHGDVLARKIERQKDRGELVMNPQPVIANLLATTDLLIEIIRKLESVRDGDSAWTE